MPLLYLPILKWKLGEQSAVKPLSDAQKQVTFPIAELQERPYDWEKAKHKKTWDKHIEDVAKATAKHWGTKYEIAFDQPLGSGDALTSTSGTAWEHLFTQLWAHGINAVPVVSNTAALVEVAALLKVSVTHGRTRWVMRFVVAPDAPTPSAADVAKWFKGMLAALKTTPALVDAVLDVGHVGQWDVKAQAAGVAQCLAAVAALGPWRNIVLASGAFPENLAGIPKGLIQIERKDWALYLEVRKAALLKSVKLRYGDYAVSHIAAFDKDPRMLKMSANLRYAHWTLWHVIKGTSVRDYGFAQYHDICRVLTSLPIFMGASFSQGDTNYDAVANDPLVKPGNATIWRKDATNHHIHVVLSQLASLSGP